VDSNSRSSAARSSPSQSRLMRALCVVNVLQPSAPPWVRQRLLDVTLVTVMRLTPPASARS
jgi:hypothetical protein